jgi:hypothetical protein
MKKMRVIFFCLIILLAFARQSSAFQFLEPWGYVWLNGAHYKTNLERNDFNSDLLRGETKVGVDILPLWADAAVEPYYVFYGVSSVDKHSWNNNGINGLGVQVKPLKGISAVDWLQDFKILYESLYIRWSNNDESDPNDKPENNYVNDYRVGAEIWHTWNQPVPSVAEDRSKLWGELWAHVSYRNTNFGYERILDQRFDNYILFFQPKVGIFLPRLFDNLSFEPYLKLDLMISGKNYYYLNMLDYGAGLRFRPLESGNLFGMNVEPLKKLKFFAEMLAVAYLKDRPPTGTDFITYDFRVGVDFDYGR